MEFKDTAKGQRKGTEILLAEADKAGRLAKVKSFDCTQVRKFAEDRAGYNAMIEANKIPKCYISGRTCSNDHFLVKVGEKEMPVGISVGRLWQAILRKTKGDSVKTTTEINKTAKAVNS